MSTTGADDSEATKVVMAYLNENKLSDKLNDAVNVVAKHRPADCVGMLIRELAKFAKTPVVTKVVGREVLDSRGNPTVEADVYVNYLGRERLAGRQTAPSGASTGSNEARELRDGDPKRYKGKGTSKAAANVSGPLADAVKGLDVAKLFDLDEALKTKDGTQLKETYGGNAITALSFALAEAGAFVREVELFDHLATAFWKDGNAPKLGLPRPMCNILNGGKHAGGDLKFQEFMIVPRAGISFKEMLRIADEVYHTLGKILEKKFGPSARNLGDEGGFAPPLTDPEETLDLIEQAIKAADYKIGEDVFLALDCAASEFYEDGKYQAKKGQFFTSDEMVEYLLSLKKAHPALISIEDGLDEKDYPAWKKLTARVAEEYKDMMIVGDDLYTTNTTLIEKGIADKWANALLLKVNQIGTVSEAMEAAQMIFKDKGNVIVSHRSGESQGHFISDLAVAIGAQFIKTGATARGERIAKYNRLLQIEEILQTRN